MGEKARLSELVDVLLRCTYSLKTKNNREFCNTIIAEFAWMGMIEFEEYKDDGDVYIYALEPLFDAFRTRVFHSSYAQLKEARESRFLSFVALVVALISLIISIRI